MTTPIDRCANELGHIKGRGLEVIALSIETLRRMLGFSREALSLSPNTLTSSIALVLGTASKSWVDPPLIQEVFTLLPPREVMARLGTGGASASHIARSLLAAAPAGREVCSAMVEAWNSHERCYRRLIDGTAKDFAMALEAISHARDDVRKPIFNKVLEHPRAKIDQVFTTGNPLDIAATLTAFMFADPKAFSKVVDAFVATPRALERLVEVCTEKDGTATDFCKVLTAMLRSDDPQKHCKQALERWKAHRGPVHLKSTKDGNAVWIQATSAAGIKNFLSADLSEDSAWALHCGVGRFIAANAAAQKARPSDPSLIDEEHTTALVKRTKTLDFLTLQCQTRDFEVGVVDLHGLDHSTAEAVVERVLKTGLRPTFISGKGSHNAWSERRNPMADMVRTVCARQGIEAKPETDNPGRIQVSPGPHAEKEKPGPAGTKPHADVPDTRAGPRGASGSSPGPHM